MSTDIITSIFLPIALAVIMFGLGLTLTVADFKRVAIFPKPVIIGLLCQMIILPIICFYIAIGFNLEPALAVGLMLLAASPGGATANLFSHLAHGDVALNITLTALNSVLALITLPIIVNFSLFYFMDASTTLPFQFTKALQVFAIVLIPASLGMLIRTKNVDFAKRAEKPIKLSSVIFLVLVISLAVFQEQEKLALYFAQVGAAVLCFNLVSLGVGYFFPLLLKVPKKQAIAVGMEIGIHNGTLAITIASSPFLLNNSAMSMPAAIYSVIMFFTAACFSLLVRKV